MSAETTLLETLITGEKHTSEIPLSGSTRRLVASRLESDGLLYRRPLSRKASVYGLTKAGKVEALRRGVLIVAPPYVFDDELEDAPTFDVTLIPLVSFARPRSHELRDWLISWTPFWVLGGIAGFVLGYR